MEKRIFFTYFFYNKKIKHFLKRNKFDKFNQNLH